jgi:HEAT repeat protein
MVFDFNIVDSATTIAENNGIPILIKLSANEDQNIKRQASLTLAKALKLEKNQVLVRESGFIPTVIQQLGSMDPFQTAYAAIIISALAKNDINQLEFTKNGVIEQLLKYLQSEDKDQRRESVGALTSFCITGIS